MTANVTVLTGPARSGKTERLLCEYRAMLTAGTPERTLWIAPAFRAAADIRGRLLSGDLDACFSPGVKTFEGFADAILQAATEEIRPISRPLKRQLLCRLIDRAHDTGRLNHFAPIAETHGLVDLVADWISEQKRLEIWPDDFEAACKRRGMTTKDRELVELYRSYQDVLNAHHLFDQEGRFWSARRMLRQGQRRPFEQLQLAVVDGFADFTRTQHEILEILAQRVQRLIISLPLEPPPWRSELFAKSLRTLDRLQESHPALTVEQLDRSSSSSTADPSGSIQLGLWPALAHVEEHLFKSPQDLRIADQTDQIDVIAAPRQLGEVELIARRIKDLIVKQHTRPGDIAVVYRRLHDVAPLVREVFREFGIPAAVEMRETLFTARAIQMLLLLLRLHVEDWPFRLLVAVLTHNYFQPDWPECADGRAVIDAERLVRRLQVPLGRDALLTEIERLEVKPVDDRVIAESPSEGEPVEQGPLGKQGPLSKSSLDDWIATSVRHAKRAYPLLKRLAGTMDALSSEATQREWSVTLEALAESTGLFRAMESTTCLEGQRETDHAAWQRLQSALAAGIDLAHWLGESPRLLSAADLLELASEIARTETLTRPSDESGRVRVLSASGVRTLTVPYLFVAGLAEHTFPSPDRVDRLYSEADYQALLTEGLPLVVRTERYQDEMLLFYEVLTRASRQLTLSYPALDSDAQPLSPSPFLIEVETVCGDGKIRRTDAPDLSPIPASDEPLGPTDLRVKSVALLGEGDPTLLAGLIQREPVPGLAENLVDGLNMAHDRQCGDSFGPFEGVLSDEAAQSDLTERFGEQTLWSPSRLEQYAKCPYQFYLERVLNIEPLEELSLEVDHLMRGRLLHETLAVVHRKLNQKIGESTREGRVIPNIFLDQFASVLNGLIEASHSSGSMDSAMREIDRRTIMRWVGKYLDQHKRYDDLWTHLDQPMHPVHFEVSFGTPCRATSDNFEDSQLEDSLSTHRPLELDLGHESIKVTGRIDRIDIGQVGKQTVFNVIDYKSGAGSGLTTKDIQAGTALQLPLYALAVERLLFDSGQAVPWQAGYWLVSKNGYTKSRSQIISARNGERIETNPSWHDLVEQVKQRLRILIAGIRSGQFPMYSVDEQCTSRCPFRTVCRVNQVRALDKSWPPQDDEEGAQ